MIEIIPIKERIEEKTVDTDKVFYIDNSQGKSITEKYNYAIENIILKSDDPFICTPNDTCHYKLEKLFEKHTIGIAGVIGTIALDRGCCWWHGVPSAGGRQNYGSGSIIQGGLNELCQVIEYPMNDHPGVHDYLATVDGCCLFFPRWIFEEGLRFDENLKDYHFYDADISLQVLERGYKVSTVDVKIKHYSNGKPPKQFEDLRKVFFAKWDKKVNGQWPISRLSKFNKE